MFSKYLKPVLIFNLLLFFSFSVSVNTFVEVKYLNYIFYVFFHLTFIYIVFYYYHYLIFILGFLYGILFDIFLLNEVSVHLLTFMSLILIYILIKKYLILLTSYQISIIIFITLLFILILELLLANLLNNIVFNLNNVMTYIVISLVIFFPSLYLFNKLNK